MKQKVKIRGNEVLFPIEIRTFEEYAMFENFKYHPLIGWPFFVIENTLHLEILREIFGKPTPQNDQKFYRWVWDHKPHVCEEYLAPLHEYSAVHISHIITKGSHTELRYNPMNTNILSKKAHNLWEFGTNEQRRKMNIWPQNQLIIKQLKNEKFRKTSLSVTGQRVSKP